ncbi:HAMP domain-containing histidine kinase [Nocardioides sp. TRM66260-LWL]|uniref:sensor histidine kinase n=1 Tax=Nocardioides sp. TRM66260-LWL TaxID=2874478 RepID=UPI001CC3678A|nr:HAMP domain-containing sensor histidine kinase [Nocardioides sp. TRM66260-LWL]MBZ5734710.1 HAMP domain-containing histidine kinase [Nocardioides sp. TRM66260-LWL]
MTERSRGLLRSLAADRARLDVTAAALAQTTGSTRVEIAIARVTDEYEVIATHPAGQGTGRHLPATTVEGAPEPLDGARHLHRDASGRIRLRLLWDGPLRPDGTVLDRFSDSIVEMDRTLRLRHAVELGETGRVRIRRAIAHHDPAAVVVAAAGALREHLDADLAYVHTTSPAHTAVRGPEGDAPLPQPALEVFADVALRIAHGCWDAGRAFVLSADRVVGADLGDRQRTRVLRLLADIGLASLLLVPVGHDGTCTGCVVLLRAPERPEWGEVEIRTALELGADVGAALHLASLFAEERHRARERERVVTTMTHELKNPLTAVSGYVEVAEELLAELGEADPAGPALAGRMAGPLAGMAEAARRIEAIVTDLLLLSRSDAARPLTTGRTDLAATVRTVVAAQADAARAAGVVLRTRLPEGDDALPVAADPEALRRVVLHLVDNAIRFGDPGHTVTVTVRRADGLLPTAVGAPMLLEVADDGWGMAPEEQGRLFSAFQRADDPRVRARPGAGLGLATVARLVGRLEGRIALRSRPDEGTVVEVYLPAVADPGIDGRGPAGASREPGEPEEPGEAVSA